MRESHQLHELLEAETAHVHPVNAKLLSLQWGKFAQSALLAKNGNPAH